MKCKFENELSPRDMKVLDNINSKKDKLRELQAQITETPKSNLIKLYLIIRRGFGTTSELALYLFRHLLQVFKDDKELHKYYEEGYSDGLKMYPFKLYRKVRTAFRLKQSNINIHERFN